MNDEETQGTMDRIELSLAIWREVADYHILGGSCIVNSLIEQQCVVLGLELSSDCITCSPVSQSDCYFLSRNINEAIQRAVVNYDNLIFTASILLPDEKFCDLPMSEVCNTNDLLE